MYEFAQVCCGFATPCFSSVSMFTRLVQVMVALIASLFQRLIPSPRTTSPCTLEPLDLVFKSVKLYKASKWSRSSFFHNVELNTDPARS